MKIHRNRLGNVGNRFQGEFRRVLCVCSAGLLRSPTLAEILSQPPFNFNTRAVGTSEEFALIPIDMAHVAWADDIVVFNVQQFDVVNELLDCAEMNGFERATVHIFPVEDNFSFRDPTLVKILKELAAEKFG
jgi:predicted protein tyrosine phosphatase